MQVKKVLARKDIYSLIVGVLIALITSTMITQVSMNIAFKYFSDEVSGGFEVVPSGPTLNQQYTLPIITWLISLVFIEVLLRLVAFFTHRTRKK